MRLAARYSAVIALGVALSAAACSSGSPSISAPVPAPSSPATIVDVAGARVTLLPAGYTVSGSPTSRTAEGREATVIDFSKQSTDPDKPRPLLTLSVSRSPSSDPVGDAAEADRSFLTINGKQAALTRFAHFKGTEGRSDSDLFILTWNESGAYLSASGMFGVTRGDVETLAAGIVVDPKGKGFASPDSERGIRAAFADAFTGRASPDAGQALGAVENGEQLRVAFDQLIARLPETARTSRVTVQQIVFSAADRATVQFAVTAEFQGRETSLTVGGREAIKLNGVWKVSQEAYCSVIRQVGIGCP